MLRPLTVGPLLGPVAPLDRPAVRLFLTSLTLLFVELLLLRWIPANVIYMSFFTNFLLIGAFLGMGVGILVGRRVRDLPLSPFGPLLFLVVWIVLTVRLDIQVRSPDELFFGLAESRRADANLLVLPLLVALVALLMAALALPLGDLLRAMPPLRAYAVDIVGSLAGVALFAIFAALATPPLAWFATVALLTLLLALGVGVRVWSSVSAVAVAGVLALALEAELGGDVWSPYYRISFWQDRDGTEAIAVNGIPHQLLYARDAPGRQPFYDQVYRWFPERRFERILVVGAGTGTDVAAALSYGATRVDAVEIDPKILEIGIARHPDRPYDDPRVRRFVNDGRAFLRNTDERYDLIVYALPDSLTLVSSTANLRLESFLFTVEAFAGVRDHLAPDGVFVLYNYFREQWLVDKLAGMLAEVYGAPPIVHQYPELGRTAAVLATGPLVGDDRPTPLPKVSLGATVPPPATDDWPFFYLRQRGLPLHYLAALGIVLLAAAAAVSGAVRFSNVGRGMSPHFFVLGAAFLLLETRSLATFGLLFGTTWWVNALVFGAILASVLLAVAINMRIRFAHPRLLYAALFGSIALAYVLPPASLLLEPAALRYLVAGALAFAPVFFANLVFSYSFRDTKRADLSFASNILGAVCGGAIEYLSLVVGFQHLLLLVAVLYGFAYLLAERWRLFADRALEPALATSS